MVAEKSPDRLPSGWTEPVKVSHGRKVKRNKDYLSGGKSSLKSKVVVDGVSPDGLPPGWTKEIRTRKSVNGGFQKDSYYTDPVSGYIFRSMKDALRYVETGDIYTCASKPRKRDINDLELTRDAISHNKDYLSGGKSSLKSKVVVDSVSPDGLPPGWIKEIGTRKSVNGGFQKDSYYTDPVSGYIFRSMKDALRYVETGDIFTCAIKPRKRDINDLELIRDAISSPSAFDGKKLRHWTTRRQLFSGKESCDTSSLAEPEAESSKERQGNSVSAAAMVNSTCKAEILEEKHSVDNANEKCSETKENSYPKTEDSKRKGGMTDFDDSGSVATPATDILQEQNFPEHGMVKHNNRKTQIDLSKSKNKRALSLPARSSKRLAGLKPDMPAIFKLSERALRAAARGVPLQFEAESEREIVHHASASKEAASDIKPSNKSLKPLEDQAVPEDHTGRQDAEKHDDEKSESQQSRLRYPFGDSWSDPCLEFAFKTLTGAMPVVDDIAIQGCFPQQPDTSHTQREGCMALRESVLPNYFQNDVSSHFGAPGVHVPIQQVPVNLTNQPPGNASLPTCSNVGPQQSSLEAGNNEYQTKMN